MKELPHRRLVLAALALTLVLFIVASVLWYAFGPATTPLIVALGILVVLLAMIGVGRQLDIAASRRHDLALRQIQALTSLQRILPLRLPLRTLGKWAVNPDFGELLLRLIVVNRPDHVLELGGGVSTLIGGYALELNGCGRLISLDHDAGYSEVTRRDVREHGLDAVVECVHAPLVDIDTDLGRQPWYDLSVLKSIPPIDLLIVDGPPKETSGLARYPALPLLLTHLSARAIVVMDDGSRPQETEISRRWCETLPGFKREFVATSAGAWILRRAEH
jgi:predicted O-methyltransferase YrrM